MIWGFAFKFFFKLWLVGRKFTYGKLVCTQRTPLLQIQYDSYKILQMLYALHPVLSFVNTANKFCSSLLPGKSVTTDLEDLQMLGMMEMSLMNSREGRKERLEGS